MSASGTDEQPRGDSGTFRSVSPHEALMEGSATGADGWPSVVLLLLCHCCVVTVNPTYTTFILVILPITRNHGDTNGGEVSINNL